MNQSTVIVFIFGISLLPLAIAFEEHTYEAKPPKLGEFCNPLDGCRNESLICIKNLCECAPGYEKSDNDVCVEVGCQNNTNCTQLDPNRKCFNGSCSQCKSGLFLDKQANRCVTKLGYGCAQNKDCWAFDPLLSSTTDNMDTLPICRSGRCVCKTNYFPTEDWSACELRRCSKNTECNPFGDDPQRFCSKITRTCQCNMGYYEESRMSVCLPYIPIQYSLMMPFWLTMIMFTICILVYISRRLAKNRLAAGEQISSSESSADQSGHALNRPPPSYETIVKETCSTANQTDSQPPNYANALGTNRQA